MSLNLCTFGGPTLFHHFVFFFPPLRKSYVFQGSVCVCVGVCQERLPKELMFEFSLQGLVGDNLEENEFGDEGMGCRWWD